jgi:hypothetical protein
MAMTWTTFHHRGEVLRAVTRTADERRDGLLPLDVDGVPETFGDELSLLGALQLRWHTRLSGHIERRLMDQPLHPDDAVVRAWQAAADELPGTLAILDHYRATPLDDEMAHAMATATAKQHVLLAAMAGRAGGSTEATAAAGRELERRARASYHRDHGSRPAPTNHRGQGLRCRLLRMRSRVAA